MNDRVYLGIDVGSKGFITLNTGTELRFFSIADNDSYKLSDILHSIKEEFPKVVCAIEEIHAILVVLQKQLLRLGR